MKFKDCYIFLFNLFYRTYCCVVLNLQHGKNFVHCTYNLCLYKYQPVCLYIQDSFTRLNKCANTYQNSFYITYWKTKAQDGSKKSPSAFLKINQYNSYAFTPRKVNWKCQCSYEQHFIPMHTHIITQTQPDISMCGVFTCEPGYYFTNIFM